jgi:hypothetical protein
MSLRGYIHEITRIPIEALLGRDLDSFSVGERLSWVEGQKTKKKEDRIYCLLGIFGVSIRMRYGIGIESALTRLIQAIGLKESMRFSAWAQESDDSSDDSSESANADDQYDEDEVDEDQSLSEAITPVLTSMGHMDIPHNTVHWNITDILDNMGQI